MNSTDTSVFILIRSRIRDYAQLVKFRLTLLVVFSSVAGYIMVPGTVDAGRLLWLTIGGFLVTGASNALNQLLEKYYDKLMKRTCLRPLPDERMGRPEALVAAILLAFGGVLILYLFVNPLTAVLGAFSLVMYFAIYTPMKRISPLAVPVGGIPGAMPPLIGWAAGTGALGMEAGVLFLMQFIWQFPHFWAIAWKANDDYSKAGFRLLPHQSGRSKKSAAYILVSSIVLLPAVWLPVSVGLVSWVAGVVSLIPSLYMLLCSVQLYNKLELQYATRLMFASFFHLPVVFGAYLFLPA